MAGAGFREFVAGEILTAEQVQTYLQDQSVMVFDDSSARSSALGTFVAEGMVTFLKDTDALEVWSGSQWDNVNDNTNSVLKSQFTAAGQIPYSSGSAVVDVLPAGQVGQILQSVGTAVQWTDLESGGGAVWFDYDPSATYQYRYYYPLDPGYYWLQFFDKDGGNGQSGTAVAFDASMSPISTATIFGETSVSGGTAVGQSIARLNLSGTATYLTFNLPSDSLIILSNAGSAIPVDAGGTPQLLTTSGTVTLSETSTVYLLGGGGGGGSKTGSYDSTAGGGSGYLTVLNSVAAGTYSYTIGAAGNSNGSSTNTAGNTGGATIFASLGTAAGGIGGLYNGGNGGSGGGGYTSGNRQAGTDGGVNGNAGGSSTGTGGTGSSVTLPWFLRVPEAAKANLDALAQGGGLYGGGAGGGVSYNSGNGSSATSYGGGGGGARGSSQQPGAGSGGNGRAGAIFIVSE